MKMNIDGIFLQILFSLQVFYCSTAFSNINEVTSKSDNSFACEKSHVAKASKILNVTSEKFEKAYYSTFQNCYPLRIILSLENEMALEIDKLKYEGGFKLSPEHTSDDHAATLKGSLGIFTVDERAGSIFVVGSPRGNSIAEFSIPDIVHSSNPDDFAIGQIIQGFTRFHDTTRVNTGIDNFFRVTGLEVIDNSIVVNYINWYDANGSETDTTIFFWNAGNLSKSMVIGPYQLQGAARAAGWISPIPKKYHDLFGGTHITGSQPLASIKSRLSVGPAAHAINLRKEIVYAPTGFAKTNTLLEFPLDNFLRDVKIYSNPVDMEYVLNNEDLKNKLWTSISGAAYGAIIPGTRTYLTIGKSGGHTAGIGYKITQDNGFQCPGPCPRVANDRQSYYWLWDIIDLVKVRLSLQKPYDIRPYSFGEFPLPFEVNSQVSGGAIDVKKNRLIFSLKNEVVVNKYSKMPLFVSYKYN